MERFTNSAMEHLVQGFLMMTQTWGETLQGAELHDASLMLLVAALTPCHG